MSLVKMPEDKRTKKDILEEFVKKKKQLINQGQYSRSFLETLTFMEESIKQQILLPPQGPCSCSNIPQSHVKKRFSNAYLNCSLAQKQYYLSLIHQAISNSPQIATVEDIQAVFTIFIKNFFLWTSKEKAKLKGYRLVTQDYEIDLRRFLVRQSKSGIKYCYVLESICSIKPYQLRFSFQENQEVQENIQKFLLAAKMGFMHTAETWSRKVNHIDLCCPSKSRKIKDNSGGSLETKIQITEAEDLSEKKLFQSTIKKPNKQFKLLDDIEDEENFLSSLTQKVENNLPSSSLNLTNKENIQSLLTISPQTQALTNYNYAKKQKNRKFSFLLLEYEHMARNQRNIINNLIPDYNIKQIQNLDGFEREQGSQQIYLNPSLKQIKFKTKFKGIPAKLVVLGLLDFMRYKQWNKFIQNMDIHMKLESQNCVISCAKYTSFVRPFTFLTHLCQFGGSSYIFMKSMEHANFQPQIFHYTVIRVQNKQDETQIIYHASSSDLQFTAEYVKQIGKLEQLLRDEGWSTNLKQNLKFGRRIDKQLEGKSLIEYSRSNEYSYGSQEFGNVSQFKAENAD